jgi:hypothetical protein
MDVNIPAWVKMVEVAVGLVSIYLGYRLFCEIPFERSRIMRRRVMTNVASGALLALFGVASLVAAASGSEPRPARVHPRGTTPSLHSPAIHGSRHKVEFFV